MYIIKQPEQLPTYLTNPIPNTIYGFIPNGFRLLLTEQRISDILNVYTDCCLYGDIEVVAGEHKFVKINPSFDPSIIIRSFALESPFFLKTTKPIQIGGNNLNELLLIILKQVIGVHVPEPVFQWNPNYQPDQVGAINTR